MNNLKIAHINTRSILAGFSEFKENLISNDYDIFMVTETWLDSRVDENEVHIPNYSFLHANRGGDKKGGGVGMFIKNTITCERIEVSHGLNCEQLWVVIRNYNKKFCMGAIYRPPNTNINEFFDIFEETISNLLPSCDNLICMGDINIDLMDLENVNTKKFQALLDVYDLSQIINEPTRISMNKMSLIDVIICSDRADIASSGVQLTNNLRTDHELIYCSLIKPIVKHPSIFKTYRDYKNFDLNFFNNELQSLPFEDILYINDINKKLTFFNNLLVSLFDRHAPLRTIRCTKPKALWLTNNIRSMIKLRNNALVKFKNSRNPEDFNYYKNLRNLTSQAIKNEKKAFLNYRIRNNRSKTLWRDLNELNIYSKKKK